MGSPIVAKVKGRMTLVGLRQSCETSEETYLEIDSATAQKINPENGNKQQRKMPWHNNIQVKFSLILERITFYVMSNILQRYQQDNPNSDNYSSSESEVQAFRK